MAKLLLSFMTAEVHNLFGLQGCITCFAISSRPFSLNFELYDHPSHRFLPFRAIEVRSALPHQKIIVNIKSISHNSSSEERWCILHLVFIYKLISAPNSSCLRLILCSVLFRDQNELKAVVFCTNFAENTTRKLEILKDEINGSRCAITNIFSR